MILAIGSLLGFISVAFGAFAEHALKPEISDESFRHIMTALRYNQIHSVVIISIGLFLLNNENGKSKSFNVAGWLFIFGTVLFSFSIYLATSLNLGMLINLVPIGGITLMIAWLSLAYCGIKECNKIRCKKNL